ncbi:MAG TPA: VOC family protein [Xanthobacteraceae bacterium]|nr:VOC family protein [Xanthobacteraceae bacterium]
MAKLTLDQVNLVCRDTEASIAFYRRLGVDIPDAAVWRTATGAHHISAGGRSSDQAIDFDLDSTTFAQCWNSGWKGLTDLKGRVVVGFSVDTRGAVDEVFHDMTRAGYRGLQEPVDAFWGARYAIIEDPDGIAVGVMSPISPDRKSPPPNV